MSENKDLELNNEELDIVDDIQQWKQSHVDKAEYDKVLADNRKLMKALMNGENVGTEAPKKPAVDKNKLRQELFGEGSNLGVCERFSKLIELRNAELADGKPDPAFGRGVNWTAEEKQQLAGAFDTYQHCLDVAEGDDQRFVMELNRLTNDVVIPRKRGR